MTGSLTACRPRRAHRHWCTHRPRNPPAPGARRDLLRRPHRQPNGAGPKALRPLRGRAPREPWPRRLHRHVCPDPKKRHAGHLPPLPHHPPSGM